ncbi:MAG: hypothetical protein ACRERU_01220 [Methylococcales bacterium]
MTVGVFGLLGVLKGSAGADTRKFAGYRCTEILFNARRPRVAPIATAEKVGAASFGTGFWVILPPLVKFGRFRWVVDAGAFGFPILISLTHL